MSRLLRADFARLWKSRIFWAGMAFTLGVGVLACTTQYREMMSIPGYHPHVDNILYSNCMFMPVVAAVFIGLFIGTEYSDGTIRNKIIVGQTRTAIYFSNLIVCVTALLMMHLINIAAIIGIGFPLVGNQEKPVSVLVIFGLISVVAIVALSAVFLLMSMMIHSKASGCVAVILVAIVMLMSALSIRSRLSEPEYYEALSVTYTGESGETHEENTKREKNPKYLEGTKRAVYEFLNDFLPGCQMLQISAQNPGHPERLPLYSLSITIAATACGIIGFRRKNIK